MLSMATQAIPRLKGMNGISWDSTTVSEVERKYIFLKGVNYPDTHQNLEGLEEKHDFLDIKFSDVFDTLLGTKKQINLGVVRKLSKRPAVLKTDPIVTITFFGKSLAAEVVHNETSLWTVTFILLYAVVHISSQFTLRN